MKIGHNVAFVVPNESGASSPRDLLDSHAHGVPSKANIGDVHDRILVVIEQVDGQELLVAQVQARQVS